ncbi:ABC transporter ATP-binding protein [Natrarchaeobius chitinivorans]|uniref:ABC transporter ATP-binding protein n=1 Tax=Natrarchaeobius chitinivorans TaxID=1679083 RepID=A0A3N6MB42_NATCH|nr:ABC transporter ATP-binding protein [Natrarchaeobius chitinivorans]RQG90846.1 ABC transporter ATP-binding protein [Natrarchaeobius chitinivorans]
MAAIEATNLTKHYGDIKAVRGIDLTVEEGSIHGFVGPNGAGKSTTMGMLVGVVTPTVGEATIGGEPVGSHAALEQLGYAPQKPVFYESMTARSYLQYIGKVAGLDGNLSGRVDELLVWLDLADAADQPINGYSGGMKRRLGLAQAMVHDPDLLILDEPTAELDPQGRASIIKTLRNLTDQGKTVFVSSHVLAELEQFIERVTIINDGQVVMSGPLSEITAGLLETYTVKSTNDQQLQDLLNNCSSVESVEVNNEAGLTVFVEDQDAFPIDLTTIAGDAGIGLRSVSREDGLETAFLEMINQETGET